MYSLLYLDLGCSCHFPCAMVMSVSEDINKLKEEMNRLVNISIQIDDDNPFNEDCNFSIEEKYDMRIELKHNHHLDWRVIFEINLVGQI